MPDQTTDLPAGTHQVTCRGYALLKPGQRTFCVDDLWTTEAAAWYAARYHQRYSGYEAGASAPAPVTVEQAKAAGWRVLPVRVEVTA